MFDLEVRPRPFATPEADALVTATPRARIGIVTADCVPILAAARDGRAVAAIHAGWRGLASGVIEAGIGALRAKAGPETGLVCAVGPSARACCYEVDEPVRAALARSYAAHLPAALTPGRPGHYRLDLAGLATHVLAQTLEAGDEIGVQHSVCTICDPTRFESHRRDGARAGRLGHFITVGIGAVGTLPGQG